MTFLSPQFLFVYLLELQTPQGISSYLWTLQNGFLSSICGRSASLPQESSIPECKQILNIASQSLVSYWWSIRQSIGDENSHLAPGCLILITPGVNRLLAFGMSTSLRRFILFHWKLCANVIMQGSRTVTTTVLLISAGSSGFELVICIFFYL